jgi:hypothetical protein
VPAAMANALRCCGRRKAAGRHCLQPWEATTLRCCGRRRAAGLLYVWLWRPHCAAVGGAELQGYFACGHGDYTARLWAAQGCRAILPVAWRLLCAAVGGAGLHGYIQYCPRLWRVHCAAVGGAGLLGYIACGHGDYTALLWAAQGRMASLPVVMATTLRCSGRRRAAGPYCLWPWRLHCAAVGGAGLQGYIACGFGECTALL